MLVKNKENKDKLKILTYVCEKTNIFVKKNKENKDKLISIFDHKIAMLQPIYTFEVSSFIWQNALSNKEYIFPRWRQAPCFAVMGHEWYKSCLSFSYHVGASLDAYKPETITTKVGSIQHKNNG